MYFNIDSHLNESFKCNSFIPQEELSGVKDREQAVLFENEELHQKLKFLTAEHILREQSFLDASVSFYFLLL